jgi:hypothetical protein
MGFLGWTILFSFSIDKFTLFLYFSIEPPIPGSTIPNSDIYLGRYVGVLGHVTALRGYQCIYAFRSFAFFTLLNHLISSFRVPYALYF